MADLRGMVKLSVGGGKATEQNIDSIVRLVVIRINFFFGGAEIALRDHF